MIEFADTLLRGGAIGVYALLMIRTAGARPFIAGPAAAFALSFGMIVYIFVSAPGQPPTALDPMLRKIPAANPFLIWLAGLSIFEDRFRFLLRDKIFHPQKKRDATQQVTNTAWK